MPAVLGMKCKLYRNTGTIAVPVWVEMGNVRDATLNLEKEKADATVRANDGYRTNILTLRVVSIEGEAIWDASDAGFTALKDNYFFDTPLEVWALTGPFDVVGSQGLRMAAGVSKFNRQEPLADVVTAAFTLEPLYGQKPEWIEVEP